MDGYSAYQRATCISVTRTCNFPIELEILYQTKRSCTETVTEENCPPESNLALRPFICRFLSSRRKNNVTMAHRTPEGRRFLRELSSPGYLLCFPDGANAAEEISPDAASDIVDGSITIPPSYLTVNDIREELS